MIDTRSSRGRRPPRPGLLALLRVVVTVHALAVFAQPVLAGQFLSGNFDMVAVHGGVAILIQLFGVLQLPAAVLLRWPGRGPLWPIGASVLLVLAEALQIGFGYARLLNLHVPLGVSIVSGMLLLLIWVWRPRLGRPRPVTGPPAQPEEASAHAHATP